MDSYDYIVVGSGSGGSVLANRLSEIPGASILVLEAGHGSVPDTVDVPYRWPEHHFTDVDWAYFSKEQASLAGQKVYAAGGKGVGGSTNLYHMIHVRGAALDYDNWAYHGATGWAFSDVLPYFQKLENQEDDTNPTAGKSGPLPIINPRDHGPNPLSEVFLDACEELGYPRSEDFNAQLDGAGYHHLNIKDGRRFGPRSAYLEPALQRPNVTLSADSFATKVILEGNRAVGVAYLQGGELKQARATSEVLLCASGLQTPKLLMLSGIGQSAHLAEFDIPTVVDLPGVGENYHDHALMVAPVNVTDRLAPDANLNMSEVCLFANTGGWPVPDLQIGFIHRAQFQPNPDPHQITAIPGLIRPLSRGTVRLASADPTENVVFDPQYLSHPSDLRRFVRAFEIAREIFSTRAFAQWGVKEVTPGGEVGSPEEIARFAKANLGSYYHYVGACKMGTDNLAVVDPQLKVYGIEGLRIADASVIPELTTGNCQSAVVMIAERAADFIKQDVGRVG